MIIDGKTGFLVDEGVVPFAQALDKLMGDKELRIKMGKAAKEEVNQYDLEKILDQWEVLIEKVVKRK